MKTLAQAVDDKALRAAAHALRQELGVEAQKQQGYLRPFADGNISMELEWVSPALLAKAAVLAYLAAVSGGDVEAGDRE